MLQASSFKNGDYLQTLSNLCSDAKTLSIEVKNSSITLLGAGGTRPVLLDRGIIVGSQVSMTQHDSAIRQEMSSGMCAVDLPCLWLSIEWLIAMSYVRHQHPSMT